MLEIVQTKCGALKGLVLAGKYAGVVEFRSVPYAKPPVGELRWKPPVEPDAWEGVRDCTQYFTVPMQLHSKESRGLPIGEDCLYMVIDTAAEQPGEKRPVFVWFHGGALENGAAYSLDSSKASLAKRGAVVVSVEQRLNVFGYMALPQLTEEQGGTSGNYGLMDEIMALNWIWDNIAAFGGDPDCITVGGQSGGTDKLVSLVASPAVRGKIKGMICESGLKWAQTYVELHDKEERCRDYLQEIGIDPDQPLEKLREIDASVLIQRRCSKGNHGEMIHDGRLILGKNTREILDLPGVMEGVNVLCGANLGEAKVMEAGLTKAQMKKTPQFNVKTAEEFYAFYKKLLGPLYDEFNFEEIVPVTDENANYTMRRLASLGLTPPVGNNSSRSLMIGRIFGEHISKVSPGSKVFAYLFECAPKAKPGYEGWGSENVSGNAVASADDDAGFSWHCCEMDYAYHCLELKEHMFEYTSVDHSVADQMNEYWYNFIKNGDPNGGDLPQWPAASEDHGYIVFSDTAKGYSGMDRVDQLIYRFVTEYFPA